VWQFSSVGVISMQDCKSLRTAVTICDTLVNTQTHTHRQTDFDRLYTISSAPAELNIASEEFSNTQYCSRKGVPDSTY